MPQPTTRAFKARICHPLPVPYLEFYGLVHALKLLAGPCRRGEAGAEDSEPETAEERQGSEVTACTTAAGAREAMFFYCSISTGFPQLCLYICVSCSISSCVPSGHASK